MMLRLYLIIGALPNTLINGTTADAVQVMADLNFIVNQVNANAAPLANTALTNANNNFTTVQSGQAATQPANFPTALQIENNSLQTLSSVLGTNTVTGRISAVPLGAYVSGQVFTFIPSNANTGATTLNVDGNGARAILNMGSALSGAELQSYKPAMVGFDGNLNAFDLLNGTPYVKGPNIPAAATLNLDGTFGDYSQVDGIATVTAMTLSPGRQKLLEFTSSPLISSSATLILGSNITPKPGDVFGFRGEAGAVVRMVSAMFAGPTYFSNSLGSDFLIASGAYTDGPSVSQPNVGVWKASGTVSVLDTVTNSTISFKLWDGNKVAASTQAKLDQNGFATAQPVSLSVIFTSPQGNIRISANSNTGTSKMVFNSSGNSVDSTLVVVRIG